MAGFKRGEPPAGRRGWCAFGIAHLPRTVPAVTLLAVLLVACVAIGCTKAKPSPEKPGADESPAPPAHHPAAVPQPVPPPDYTKPPAEKKEAPAKKRLPPGEKAAPREPAGDADVRPTEPPSGVRAFPWPPPKYSEFSTIPREWVAPDAVTTLASVAVRLERAFEAAGYGERSYYWIPDGFALVSRIERIQSDATPIDPPGRWAVETPSRVSEGFIDHIRALFNAPPGFYRVIVFAVTDQIFSAGERQPTSDEARGWLSAGSVRLPESIGRQAYSDGHYTTALIYEFERPAGSADARLMVPSDVQGRDHLERAGLLRTLMRARP
jgi:hypothetical protein